jgi:hypothetical protein
MALAGRPAALPELSGAEGSDSRGAREGLSKLTAPTGAAHYLA